MEIDINQLNQIVEPLLAWFYAHRRDLPWRHDSTPYRVWVSEIMLQQTRVDPVIPYYLRFMEEVPSVEALARLPQDRLMKLWEGLGYYSRARHLQEAAVRIVEQGGFPADFGGWLALPGIGAYTAGAICSIALGLPTPAVDGNVLRVLSRVLGSRQDIALPATKTAFTEALRQIYPPDTSGFTQSLMELGALVCLPNGEPKCAECPLAAQCAAKREGAIDEIPVKAEKKKRKIEKRTVYILQCGACIALSRRPPAGLLANLWEFPNESGWRSGEEVQERFSGVISDLRPLESSVHIFTHIEWHMRGFWVKTERELPGYTWVTIEDALAQKAIPSAFSAYTKALRIAAVEVKE